MREATGGRRFAQQPTEASKSPKRQYVRMADELREQAGASGLPAPPSIEWESVDGKPTKLWAADQRAGFLTASHETDWFIDPTTRQPVRNAPLLLTPVVDDFQFVAHVRAPLAATFDAVALFVYATPTCWAKLLLERSPQGADTIVTVVTREVSDDANGPTVPTPGQTWLRVSRTQDTYAFHYSPDRTLWSLARLFTIGPSAGHRIGLSVQSPQGDGLTGQAAQIAITNTTLADPRSGQ